ncbi:MAG TPA: phospholipase D-like domain-containing protein [Syntrophorhabdaceae bacterium]|nr:phospholipase D-like domain-containing protein [Syntrophorhabdaceae bacterium]
MSGSHQRELVPGSAFSSQDWAEQVFSRTAGAPITGGNKVRLLKDASENYPVWLEAMDKAEKWIHFETYILYEDKIGLEFSSLMERKARQGVKVRLLYDWLGAFGKTSRQFWQTLRRAGVEVRCFNPPKLESPLGWITRDHRKMIGIDGSKAFVTGLCVGNPWIGDPARNIPPWRDTGIEVIGPAVADIEMAFSQVWSTTGKPLSSDEIPLKESTENAGNTPVRIVATIPSSGGVYRIDQQIAALATNSLWLTDAYFLGTTSYVQALRAAAMDGVDVRLLIPGASDIPVLSTLSRAGYKTLIESGVRLFEWNGSMVHAKTAVADSYWARVGSTNLNLASWIGNYELDVIVEDKDFALQMEEVYLSDLQNTTEIILKHRGIRRITGKRLSPSRLSGLSHRGSVGRIGAGAIRVGNTMGAAITNRRILGTAEMRIPFLGGIALLVFGGICVLAPRFIAYPFAFLSIWFGFALLFKTARMRRLRNGNSKNTR